MRKIPLGNILQARATTKIIGLVLLLLIIVFSWWLIIVKNPRDTKAFTFNASTLTVAAGEVLYIGKDGVESQRPWDLDTAPTTDVAAQARSTWGAGRQLTRTLSVPVDKVYGAAQLINMNYSSGTGGCPTGYTICKAILTDGTGAIIQVTGDIVINGTVFLGDRVVLRAANITLGASGRIIGSGQNSAPALTHNNSALGGIGAKNGGQASTGTAGAPQFTPTGNYAPNDVGYYTPLTADTKVTQYFKDENGADLMGSTGVAGGTAYNTTTAICAVGSGQAGTREIGIGGSGGSGGANGTANVSGTGAGGGGGGGYGIVLDASNTITTAVGSLITVKGGDGGAGARTGGSGGAGGGGVVVFRAQTLGDSGTVTFSGGLGAASLSQYNLCQQTNSAANGAFKRVVVFPPLVIKKEVHPIARNGTGNTAYNPYALQLDDIVQVTILVSEAAGNFSLQDVPLKIPYGPNTIHCDPTVSGLPSPAISDSGAVVGGVVNWATLTPDAARTKNVNYYCKMSI